MSYSTNELKPHPDMRLHDNREILTNIEHHHLNLNGTPDLRFRENHQKAIIDDVEGLFNKSHEIVILILFVDPAALFNIPTKKDGTADLRFAESKEAEELGVISSDEIIEGKNK
jgi:hypothetical protein